MEVEKPVYIEKIVQVRACDALSVSRCRFAFQTSLHKGGLGMGVSASFLVLAYGPNTADCPGYTSVVCP